MDQEDGSTDERTAEERAFEKAYLGPFDEDEPTPAASDQTEEPMKLRRRRLAAIRRNEKVIEKVRKLAETLMGKFANMTGEERARHGDFVQRLARQRTLTYEEVLTLLPVDYIRARSQNPSGIMAAIPVQNMPPVREQSRGLVGRSQNQFQLQSQPENQFQLQSQPENQFQLQSQNQFQNQSFSLFPSQSTSHKPFLGTLQNDDLPSFNDPSTRPLLGVLGGPANQSPHSDMSLDKLESPAMSLGPQRMEVSPEFEAAFSGNHQLSGDASPRLEAAFSENHQLFGERDGDSWLGHMFDM